MRREGGKSTDKNDYKKVIKLIPQKQSPNNPKLSTTNY